VEAEVPDAVSRDVFDAAAHPGWDDPHDVSVAQAVGEAWLRSRRPAVLLVPSVVTGQLCSIPHAGCRLAEYGHAAESGCCAVLV
jgi:RES domain-containing protein